MNNLLANKYLKKKANIYLYNYSKRVLFLLIQIFSNIAKYHKKLNEINIVIQIVAMAINERGIFYIIGPVSN
jgi:hypothetical protein